MKKIPIIIYRYLKEFGLEPIKFLYGIKNIFFYFNDYINIFRSIKKNNDFQLSPSYPCLHDKHDNGGVAKGHYFHQDLLIAQKIYQKNPARHIDIGSRVDGFIAHIATFREIEVFDIRNIENKTDGIIFKQADLMDLDEKYINYTDSISSLHVIEHFGLGRYGDPIDTNGHIKGLDNIHKILKKGGIFYFSVPIGPQRIEFNAHRVFSIKYLSDILQDRYTISNFSYVDDNGDLHKNIDIKLGLDDNFNCNFGCGIFELLKI